MAIQLEKLKERQAAIVAKKKKSKGQIPPPVCKAILLCDAILSDPFTGKSSVIGIFERFVVPQFPGNTSPFFLYMQMTSGIGSYRITVEMRSIPDGQNIARADVIDMEFKDRAEKNLLVLPIPPLPLPKAGEYDFIVFANDQEIDRQRFTAVSRPENKDAQGKDKDEENEEDED